MNVNRRSFIRNASLGTAAALVSPAFAADPKRYGYKRDEMPRPFLKSEDMYFQGTPFKGRVSFGGRPVAGVVVTNGRDSVKTAKDGTYALPEYPEARFISLTVPSGYRTDVWYHDAWQRLGTFDFYLEGSPDTAAGKGCRFVHMSDSEIPTPRGQKWIENVRALAAREKANLIVHTGDISGRRGLLAHFQLMNEQTMGVPVVYTPGNHDLVSTFPWGEAEFEALYGPAWHSFDMGGVHFVCTPHVNGDRPPSYCDDQIADWIRGDLALVDPKTPVVLLNHWLCNGNVADRCGLVYGGQRPLDLKASANLVAYVYGHTHNHWVRRKNGVTFLNSAPPNKGGIDNSPGCVRVIDVAADGKVTSRTFYGSFAPLAPKEDCGALWTAKLPAGVLHGGLVDGGEVVLCATADEDGAGTGGVYAIAKSDGHVVWKAPVGNAIRGSLAVAAGNVIGIDVEAHVYAFRLSDGQPVWDHVSRTRWGGSVGQMVANGATASPDGKTVVVGTGYRQELLEAATGKVIWHDAHYGEYEPSPVAPALTDEVVLTPANWGPLCCNDAKTGKIRWQTNGYGFAMARPIVADGKAYCLSEAFIGEIDLATGKQLRRVAAGTGHDFACPGNVLVTERFFVKGTSRNGLVAIDRKTLACVWKGTCGPSRLAATEYAGAGHACVPTTPVLLKDGKTVCAAAADGAIHFWNLADGRHLRQIDTGVAYLGGAVASDDRVFAADLAGCVRAFAV